MNSETKGISPASANTAGHTPGKWSAECVGSTGHENPVDVYEVIADGYKRVAEHVDGRDAYLLAAAKELLIALKTLVATERLCDDGDPTLALAREQADAAIAKAEGTP